MGKKVIVIDERVPVRCAMFVGTKKICLLSKLIMEYWSILAGIRKAFPLLVPRIQFSISRSKGRAFIMIGVE